MNRTKKKTYIITQWLVLTAATFAALSIFRDMELYPSQLIGLPICPEH